MSTIKLPSYTQVEEIKTDTGLILTDTTEIKTNTNNIITTLTNGVSGGFNPFDYNQQVLIQKANISLPATLNSSQELLSFEGKGILTNLKCKFSTSTNNSYLGISVSFDDEENFFFNYNSEATSSYDACQILGVCGNGIYSTSTVYYNLFECSPFVGFDKFSIRIYNTQNTSYSSYVWIYATLLV